MFKLLILLICLVILLILCLALSPKKLLTPQSMFLVGFVMSAGYAIFFVDKMQLDFAEETLLTLVGGALIFVLVSLAVDYICNRDKYMPVDPVPVEKKKEQDNVIDVELWKLVIFMVVEALANLLTLKFIIGLGASGSLGDQIYYFRNVNMFTTDTIDMPTIVSLFRLAAFSITSVMVYLFIHQLVFRYSKHRLVIFINIVLGMTASLITGGRGGLIGYLFDMVVIFYFLTGAKTDWNIKLSMRKIILLVALALGFLVLFYFSAELLGRGKQRNFVDYVCVYLSAELKNLDTFIRAGKFGTPFSNSQTWGVGRAYLAKRFSMGAWGAKLDLPYQAVGNYTLGNVYTIYYAFLYDGGYLAMVIYTFIMAVFNQFSYQYTLKGLKKNGGSRVKVSLLFTSKMLFVLLFSFFSDKFYETIADIGFIRTMIIWLLLSWFISDFKFLGYEDRVSEMKITAPKFGRVRRSVAKSSVGSDER